jgi:hypothetical protein
VEPSAFLVGIPSAILSFGILDEYLKNSDASRILLMALEFFKNSDMTDNLTPIGKVDVFNFFS